jgi:sugar transferase (PEP-CTERM system associated)
MLWIQLPTSRSRRILCIGVESGILFAAFLASVALRFLGTSPEDGEYPLLVPKAIIAVLVLQTALYYADLYEDFTSPSRVELLLRLTKAFLGATVALTLLFYLTPTIRFGRGIVAFFLPLSLLAVFAWRVACLHLWGSEAMRDAVLILGTGAAAQDLARETLARASLEFRIVGFVGTERAEVGRRLVNPGVVGTFADLPMLVERERVDRIVVALEDFRGQLPVTDLLRCRLAGVRVEEAATFFERLTGKILIRDLRASWFVFSDGFQKPAFVIKTKRLIEFVVAGVAFVVLAPFMALLWVLIKLDSRGPVFYRQERVGERGRAFGLIKLRTMRTDAEDVTGPVWANREGDVRTTRLGRLLRLARLDEMPQVLNVLRGEMSFVGPRPERPHFVDKLRAVIPYYDERHTVKPGITGWAQIKFGYGSNLEDAEEKLAYDLYYIKHMTWLFDVRILAHTLKVMIFGRGAR